MTTVDRNWDRWGAAILVIAPATLLVALFAHPYLPGRLPNDTAVAEAVAAGPTRWGLVHLAASLASGLIILAFLAVRGYLRKAGEERFSPWGVPFIVLGSISFAVLPGMEFVPLAVSKTGATVPDIAAAQAELQSWFVSVLVLGAVLYAIGVLLFAKAITASAILGRGLAWFVVVALIVMAASRFVPLAAVQFYVQSIAGVAALWPLAYVMWTRTMRPVQ